MGARWDTEDVDLERANALGDVIRAAASDAGATSGELVAALALCMFNVSGVGEMAERRGYDRQAELFWFLAAFIQTVGLLTESRYGSH